MSVVDSFLLPKLLQPQILFIIVALRLRSQENSEKGFQSNYREIHVIQTLSEFRAIALSLLSWNGRFQGCSKHLESGEAE